MSVWERSRPELTSCPGPSVVRVTGPGCGEYSQVCVCVCVSGAGRKLTATAVPAQPSPEALPLLSAVCKTENVPHAPINLCGEGEHCYAARKI